MEELYKLQADLQEENTKLWGELKEKNSRIVNLNDEVLLQKDILKRQFHLKRQLLEYLETIKSMQKNIIYLQKENKFLEQKLFKAQLAIKEISSRDVNEKQLANENLSLKMKVFTLEKEIRRYTHLWEKNLNVTSDIVSAHETITTLEQRLLECQTATTELNRVKNELVECEGKLKNTNITNGILKDELQKNKAELCKTNNDKEEIRKQLTKYIKIAVKLKEEKISMEHFVEKSFRLEGVLAELDDLNVVFKKQETVLGMLFDENQSLKEDINYLFNDINVLKDRNWKLERYTNDLEDSCYKMEKNTNSLEQKLDCCRAIEMEMENLKHTNGEIMSRNQRLEEVNNSLAVKLTEYKKNLNSATYSLNVIKTENQKYVKENSSLKVDLTERYNKLSKENEVLRMHLEKQHLPPANYTEMLNQFKNLQKKYTDLQELDYKLKEELCKTADENIHLRRELESVERKETMLKANCDQYIQELRNSEISAIEKESWLKQLEYQLNKQHYPMHD